MERAYHRKRSAAEFSSVAAMTLLLALLINVPETDAQFQMLIT